MEAWTCWLASAFTVVESAVCIVISVWFNDDCDCWLLLVSFPAAALGCDDDDCPAMDGASLGLRGNKLAFKVGCIANSGIQTFVRKFKLQVKKCFLPCSVKLNSCGNSRPLGKTLLPSRSSLKKGWAQACNGVIRAPGVYSSKRETNAIASGGVRTRNTYEKGRKNI